VRVCWKDGCDEVGTIDDSSGIYNEVVDNNSFPTALSHSNVVGTPNDGIKEADGNDKGSSSAE